MKPPYRSFILQRWIFDGWGTEIGSGSRLFRSSFLRLRRKYSRQAVFAVLDHFVASHYSF